MISVKFSRYFWVLIIVMVSAYFIPKTYWMKFEKSVRAPFVAYSPVSNDYVITRSQEERGDSELRWKDTQGNLFTREENDSLLPFFNYRQLASTGKMPDTIAGVPVPLDTVRMNNFTFRLTPSTLNAVTIPLGSLMESNSGRVRLEMPEDFFRIDERMEFINSNTNTVNEEKSKLFTDKLNEEGFVFPAKIIAGNPNPKKPFDEGYFVLDNKDQLFHIKMVKGEPFCVNTKIPEGTGIRYISVNELNIREFYAYIITNDNRFLLLSYDNYKLLEVPVENYVADRDVIFMISDMFYRTTSIVHPDHMEVFTCGRDYKLIDKYSESWETNETSTAGNVFSYIFPFTLEFESGSSDKLDINLEYSGVNSFAGILFALILWGVLIKVLKRNFKSSATDIIIIMLTGIYGLIAVFAAKNIE